MPVSLECLSIIIPIAKLNAIHESEAETLMEQSPGGEHDGDLVRISTMNQIDAMLILDSLKKKGLRPTRRKQGVEHWEDLCIVDRFSGPTLPCEWLDWDREKGIAWMKKERRS
jgi:hypothetical protein